MKRKARFLVFAAFSMVIMTFVLSGCARGSTPAEETLDSSAEAVSADTLIPTNIPIPTSTSLPTATLVPLADTAPGAAEVAEDYDPSNIPDISQTPFVSLVNIHRVGDFIFSIHAAYDEAGEDLIVEFAVYPVDNLPEELGVQMNGYAIRGLPPSENLQFFMWMQRDTDGNIGPIYFYERNGDEWSYVMTGEDIFATKDEFDDEAFTMIYLSEDSEIGRRFLEWFKNHGGSKEDIGKLFGRD